MRLDELTEEKNATIVEFKGGQKMQDRMTQHGIYPGDIVRIVRTAPLDGPYLVDVSGRELIIGRTLAKKILVELEK